MMTVTFFSCAARVINVRGARDSAAHAALPWPPLLRRGDVRPLGLPSAAAEGLPLCDDSMQMPPGVVRLQALAPLAASPVLLVDSMPKIVPGTRHPAVHLVRCAGPPMAAPPRICRVRPLLPLLRVRPLLPLLRRAWPLRGLLPPSRPPLPDVIPRPAHPFPFPPPSRHPPPDVIPRPAQPVRRSLLSSLPPSPCSALPPPFNRPATTFHCQPRANRCRFARPSRGAALVPAARVRAAGAPLLRRPRRPGAQLLALSGRAWLSSRCLLPLAFPSNARWPCAR